MNNLLSFFWRYIYISFGISLSNPVFSISLSTVSELFCGEVFQTFVISSAVLLPNKSPAASAVFSIASYEAVLSVFVADCLA